jgi:GR25 family glycosyltransferase involved in LPS biosynthesis
MQCSYINLDRAVQRREDIEASFKAAARPGWRLDRFRALDAAFIEEQRVEGSRTRSEKACFMSHRAVLQKYAGSAEHLLVVEDDVVFGAATFDIVDGFLHQNAQAEWDLLFLDIGTLDMRDMLTMYFNREKFIRQRKVIPLDLARLPFFGSNAYIVNRASFGKVLDCLDSGLPIDIEYDMFLSKQIRKGALKAAVLFPFLTTLSRNAAMSQIQRSGIDTVNLARNIFRNMMWLESAPGKFQDDLAELDARLAGAGHANLAKVLAAICDDYDDPGFNSDQA